MHKEGEEEGREELRSSYGRQEKEGQLQGDEEEEEIMENEIGKNSPKQQCSSEVKLSASDSESKSESKSKSSSEPNLPLGNTSRAGSQLDNKSPSPSLSRSTPLSRSSGDGNRLASQSPNNRDSPGKDNCIHKDNSSTSSSSGGCSEYHPIDDVITTPKKINHENNYKSLEDCIYQSGNVKYTDSVLAVTISSDSLGPDSEPKVEGREEGNNDGD